MDIAQIYGWLESHRQKTQLFIFPVLALMMGGVFLLVYTTGGIKYVYAHSMYIPVLLGGIVLGARSGVIVGLVAGVVLGPLMPIDTITGESQATINWVYRSGFFVLAGLLSGIASDGARKYVQHIKWIAQHDIYSKLPNRSALIEKLSLLSHSKEKSNGFLLALVYVENEMELLSTYGSNVLDDTVPQLATRFDSITSKSGHVFRVNAAQLGVLSCDTSGQDADGFLDTLITSFSKPLVFGEIPVHVDVRVGCVVFPGIDQTPGEYLKRAEIALSEACDKALDYVSYSSSISAANMENVSILGKLQNALETKQLSLHYQPKVSCTTGEVTGVEALIRWNHPELGNIPPGIFIPRAEQSTLINQVTDFVLNEAMAQISAWQRSGLSIPIAVNISTRNLLKPGFTDRLLQMMQHHGVHGEQLELEVTESALMLDADRVIGELVKLADHDITIAIDDFGTGYSSLQYLHKLPVSQIKIDQSFILRLPTDNTATSIVEAAISLAKKLKIRTIAEGVEDEAAYSLLRDIGCDVAQGYLVAHPQNADDYGKWHVQQNGRFCVGGAIG